MTKEGAQAKYEKMLLAVHSAGVLLELYQKGLWEHTAQSPQIAEAFLAIEEMSNVLHKLNEELRLLEGTASN